MVCYDETYGTSGASQLSSVVISLFQAHSVYVVNGNPFMCCRSLTVIYALTLVTMQTEAVKSDVGRKIARLKVINSVLLWAKNRTS